jgi:flagellar motor switch protein FliN/FliY
MGQTKPEAEADAPDAQLDRAIEELRGVLKEEEKRGDSGVRAEAAQAGNGASGSIIMNIPVDVQIVLGSTEMPVSELMALQKGSTVALNRRIGEPVDVVVNGRRIARGEITVLESDPSRFGIRLTEIIAAAKSA